jgi:hypothetical protein
MSRTLDRLLALLLCLALVQGALPAREAMACVTGSGRVLDLCPREGHRRSTPTPVADPPRVCCHKSAVAAYVHHAGKSLGDGNVHCATVSVAKALPSADTMLLPVGVDMPILAAAFNPFAPNQPLIVLAEVSFPDDADPPPSRPFAPDLGRAPPIA